ncbi:DJ-1/PfpI family protein, partial [Psychrobacter sp. GW64-MNA-CIBAN-0177]
SPNSIADFVKNDMADSTEYAAIFIPGGHGAMLGLPEDKNLGALLRWGHDNDLFTLAICHGPAALLAADLNSPDSSDEGNSKRDFIFKGYK